jgi:hypothetical protein
MKDEDGITLVNHAKTQATAADYELAQEEYVRKKAMAARSKSTKPSTASSIAARIDGHPHPAQQIRELRELRDNPAISQEDRDVVDRRLHEAQLACGAQV